MAKKAIVLTKRKVIPVEGSPREERMESKAERNAENKAGLKFKAQMKKRGK